MLQRKDKTLQLLRMVSLLAAFLYIAFQKQAQVDLQEKREFVEGPNKVIPAAVVYVFDMAAGQNICDRGCEHD